MAQTDNLMNEIFLSDIQKAYFAHSAVYGVGPDVVSECAYLTHCFVWIAKGKIQTKQRKILEP